MKNVENGKKLYFIFSFSERWLKKIRPNNVLGVDKIKFMTTMAERMEEQLVMPN